jgi:histone H1/5
VAVPKPHILKAALKSGVEKGILVKVKASYKVSAEAKKPKKKKAAPKKKKAAPKKVCLLISVAMVVCRNPVVRRLAGSLRRQF